LYWEEEGVDILNENFQELLLNFLTFLPKLVVALVVFIIGLLLAGVLSAAVRRALRKRDVDPELTILIGTLTRWSIIVLASVLALEQVNFDLTAFLAGLGIVGFTIGFAIQDVSKNFVAGLLILLQQPFDLGDAIEVGDFSGVVLAVDLRATEIRTFDGRYVTIPNADVFTSPIVNFSRADRRRVNLDIGVAYDSDLDQVTRTTLEAIQKIDGLLEDPAPQVVYNSFGESAIDFSIYFWVDMKKSDPWKGQTQGIGVLKEAFEAAGIEIPYPIRTVFLQQ
jgi:small conductance mechanosensitive channel